MNAFHRKRCIKHV